jgi:hypothetical protein
MILKVAFIYHGVERVDLITLDRSRSLKTSCLSKRERRRSLMAWGSSSFARVFIELILTDNIAVLSLGEKVSDTEDCASYWRIILCYVMPVTGQRTCVLNL